MLTRTLISPAEYFCQSGDLQESFVLDTNFPSTISVFLPSVKVTLMDPFLKSSPTMVMSVWPVIGPSQGSNL